MESSEWKAYSKRRNVDELEYGTEESQQKGRGRERERLHGGRILK